MSFLYRHDCAVCNHELTCEADIDEDNDIIMFTNPCPVCMDAAKKEGLREGERRYKDKPKGKDES